MTTESCKICRRAFTLIELLVVIAIIALLTVITIPAINHGIESGRRSTCRSNLRQCGLACLQYADDHGTKLPPAVVMANTTDVGCNIEHSNTIEKWGLIYPQYTQNLGIFWCPSRRAGNRYSRNPGASGCGIKDFGVNIGAPHCESSYAHVSGTPLLPLRQKDIREPSRKVWGVDVFWSDATTIGGASSCHGKGYHNVLYFDGRVSGFVDNAGYLETINIGGGHGARLPLGYAYIEANDGQ